MCVENKNTSVHLFLTCISLMTNDVDDLCHLTEGIRIFNVIIGTLGFKSVILLFGFLFVPSFLCSHFLIVYLLDKLRSL